MRSTHAGGAAAARAPARDPRARGVAADARRRCPAQTEGYWAARARRPPRRPRARRAGGDRGLGLPAARSRRPRTRASSRASTRRGWRAPPARGRRCASWRCSGAGAGRCGRRRPGAQQAGMSHGRVRRASSSARCSSTATTRSPPGASCTTSQARLIERLSRRARAAHRGRGHRPARCRVDGPHLGQLRRQAQHALGRGLHRPARGLAPRAASASRSRRARAASRSRGSSSSSREGRVVEARAERGEEYLRDHARHRRRRLAARRDRHRHELRHRPPGRDDPARREDRRHRAPRGRPLLPETGGTNESAVHWDMICDLRPRRPPDRRRRADAWRTAG